MPAPEKVGAKTIDDFILDEQAGIRIAQGREDLSLAVEIARRHRPGLRPGPA